MLQEKEDLHHFKQTADVSPPDISIISYKVNSQNTLFFIHKCDK